MSAAGVWPAEPPGERERHALAEAERVPYWLDSPRRPPQRPPLEGEAECDLAIVGGGFTGLWAALQALEREPGRSVVVLEGERIVSGASGRNGGFASDSLTHGIGNGLARFATEYETIERLGHENYDGWREAIARHGIDCALEQQGTIGVALREHEVEWAREEAELLRAHGRRASFLDAEAVRAEVDSPLYRAGVWRHEGEALVDPGRLGWGLAAAAERLGARICEATPVSGLARAGEGVRLATPAGTLRAGRVLLATNAFPPLVRSIRRYVVPVYDYVLVTEPLGERLGELGWERRQGLDDLSNLFHYYRLTPDDRLLWGGYFAEYGLGRAFGPGQEQRDELYERLAQHLLTVFPQLEGVRFSHRWAGAIDTCSRFSVFFGTALGGRLAYAAGYTGLGVVSTRFGAAVALDLVDGRESEATRLRMVRRKPIPFPPEPARWGVIELTKRMSAREDRTGRRGLWLRAMDRLGVGFNS